MQASRRALLAAMAAGALAGCAGCAGRTRTVGRTGTGTGTRGGAPGAPGAPGTAAPPSSSSGTPAPQTTAPAPPTATRAEIVARYGDRTPHTWGFDAPGVVRALPGGGRVIALTFDACGGPGGGGYDARLIDFLRHREVPATLFLNSRWIDANPRVFRKLAGEPLFEIANHGTRHRPLSVSGRSAYGIAGTRNAGEVYDEIAGNRGKLTRLLGAPPRFFRPGTAYTDEVAARIVTDLGERFAGFSVNGDAGATFTADEVHRTVAAAPAGSIVICHMNHPEGGTAEGIAAAVPRLLASGHRFVRLSDEVR